MQAETMQKQRTTSKTKSYICRILLLLGVLLLAVGLWYGVQGYQMYRNVLAETPIAEKTAAIEQQESFVPYDALPQIYVDAVISVEDQRFFSHSGVDISAMIRALWNDLRTRSFAEGGSTISQQLTDYEAVMLAGLPNAPSAYALQEHADLAEQRMQQVLQAMVANQKLTQSEANEILQEKS